MPPKVATYHSKVATYGLNHICFIFNSSPNSLAALTIATIQTGHATIHLNHRFGVTFIA